MGSDCGHPHPRPSARLLPPLHAQTRKVTALLLGSGIGRQSGLKPNELKRSSTLARGSIATGVDDGRIPISTILGPERKKPFDSQEKSSQDEKHFDLIGRSSRVRFRHGRNTSS
jgi:hypothetical protein